MSLKNRLHDELNRLAPNLHSPDPRVTLDLSVDNGRLECQLTAIDQLACAFEYLTYRSPQFAGASIEQLSKAADSLSKRLSYLLESISPVETDSEGCVVQMRSNPPHRDDDGTRYYELVVRRGEITLCRFSKVPGQARQVVPANVTREVFCRLSQDLSTVQV